MVRIAVAEGGSGSRLAAPQRDAAASEFTAGEGGHSSSEEGSPRGEPQEPERRPARILFDFMPEPDSDEVAVSIGESVQVRCPPQVLRSRASLYTYVQGPYFLVSMG